VLISLLGFTYHHLLFLLGKLRKYRKGEEGW
jgi:hypothetical protein